MRRLPFDELRDVQFLANIALFAPFGLLVAAAWPRTNAWWIILLRFSASVAIELVQRMPPSRYPTLSDIIANTLGTVIGCCLISTSHARWEQNAHTCSHRPPTSFPVRGPAAPRKLYPMQRSEDRGLLGRSSSDTAPVTPMTRRERRLLSTSAAVPLDDSAREATAPTPAGFSLDSLFSRTPDELPAGRPTILTVCTGNICRSPLAAVILASRLAQLEIDVRSAGTQAMVGHGMPAPSRALAARHGVAPALIDGHRASTLTEQMLADADLILTMTAEHTTLALQLAPRRLHRTFTLREFARLAVSLTDEQLTDAARGAANPRSRLNAVVAAIADQRGVAPRATGTEDVIDPYRQSQEIYEQSLAEMLPALERVDRVVRAAVPEIATQG